MKFTVMIVSITMEISDFLGTGNLITGFSPSSLVHDA